MKRGDKFIYNGLTWKVVGATKYEVYARCLNNQECRIFSRGKLEVKK